jgi:hypothetical protein
MEKKEKKKTMISFSLFCQIDIFRLSVLMDTTMKMTMKCDKDGDYNYNNSKNNSSNNNDDSNRQ